MESFRELSEPQYHEKQRRQLCLLHALNNIFQREEFKENELNQICETLDDRRWFNMHRSWIGLGNYDVNILMCALKQRGLCSAWFDSRLPLTRINHGAVLAYIFNTPSGGFVPFIKGRHWFTVLRVDSKFFNLDSKLPKPVRINDFEKFASEHLAHSNQLILVATEENVDRCVLHD